MNNNLLIVGAGVYGLVAKEIAEDMGCFGRIDFVDDNAENTPNGLKVIGKSTDIEALTKDYSSVIVAIGNPEARLGILKRIEKDTSCKIATLISPRAYISPSAKVGTGCIIEPMATVHTGCILETGCVVSAGAVINHASVCLEGVHVDCNATVSGYSVVPSCAKIGSGAVYASDEKASVNELFRPFPKRIAD